MDTFASILTHSLVQRLGWALLHSLWQGLLASLLLGILLFFLRRRSAGARYLCSCAALVLALAMPTATLFLVHVPHHAVWTPPAPSELPLPSEAPNETPAYNPALIDTSIPPRAMPPSAVIPVAPTTPSSVGISEQLEPYLPWAVLLWLVGVCILSLRLLGGWVKVQRIKRRCVQPAAAQWQEMLDNLMYQLRISRPVRLLESAIMQAPAAIGWLKPVILLPACALTGLTPDQLRMILAHELAHIRRYDYLVNLLQTVVETLLFYHPAVWWISRRIRAERENCCDDIAVAAGGRPLDYARALTELESLRGLSPSLVAAASGGSLLERIRRILNLPSAGHNYLSRSLAGLLIIALVLTAAVGLSCYSRSGESASDKPVCKQLLMLDPPANIPAEHLQRWFNDQVIMCKDEKTLREALQDASIRNSTWFQSYPNENAALDDLSSNLSVKQLPGSSFLEISFTSRHATDAPIVVNTVIQKYQSRAAQVFEGSLKGDLELLRRKENQLQADLEQVRKQKQRFYDQQGSTAGIVSGANATVQTYLVLAAEVTRLETEKLQYQTAYENLKAGKDADRTQIPISPEMMQMIEQDPQIRAVENQLLTLQQELAVLLDQGASEQSREVASTKSRIKVVQDALLQLREDREKQVRDQQIQIAYTQYINAAQAELQLRERMMEAESKVRDLDRTLFDSKQFDQEERELNEQLVQVRALADQISTAISSRGRIWHKPVLSAPPASDKTNIEPQSIVPPAVRPRAESVPPAINNPIPPPTSPKFKSGGANKKEGLAPASQATTRPTNDDPSSEQVLNVTFRDASDLNQLVRSGGNWKIKNNELLGTCGGDQSWATCRTSFKRISSVLIRGQIVPPSTQNFRVWVGPIHLIFNWELADQNHYRTNQDLTVTQPRALTAGQWHDIEFKQKDSEVVVTVDGKTVYQTTAEMSGTISVQAAWDSTIAVQQMRIVGEPDPAVTVEPLSEPLPMAFPGLGKPDAAANQTRNQNPKRERGTEGALRSDPSKSGTLTVKVSDRDGQPAKDVSVFIIPADQSAGLVQTNQEGIFSSDHAPAGRYSVVAFKGNKPPVKEWKDHQGYLMGVKRDVQVTAGETTTVQLQPTGTATLDVTLAKPDPYHLEWGIVLLALSPIELPTGQTGKPAAFPIPADLLGMFFVEPGKPCTIHNLPEGLIHVRATPSDPGPMDFSPNIAVFMKAGQKNTLDLQLTPRNRLDRFEGKLEFDKDVKIGLSAAADETKDGVSLLTMKFSKRDMQLSAEMKLGVISWPKTKWRFTVDLLDSQSNVLKSIQKVFENSGIALGKALLGSEQLELNLGPWSDVSATTRFAVSIEQISTQTATQPAAVPTEFDLNQRELFFHGLDLSKAPVETNVRRLPDLWHAVPPGSGSYEIRPEVQILYSGLDGVVYWLPDQDMFYIQHDHHGSNILHYYGPFRGDPRKILNLPSTTQPTTTTDEPLWGEAIEGAQIRLQPEKKTWKTGETPTFRVDARNTGSRTLHWVPDGRCCEFEVDGQWYWWKSETENIDGGSRGVSPILDFSMGRFYRDLPITMAGSWEPLSDKEVAEFVARYSPSALRSLDPEKWVRLKLSPGRHTIRIAYYPWGKPDQKVRNPGEPEVIDVNANIMEHIRVVSNPVEIEVMPADSAKPATRPAAESTGHFQEQDDREAFAQHATISRFLLEGGTRDEAAKRFRMIAEHSSQSRYGQIAGELATLLMKMTEEDRQYRYPGDIALLSEPQRIEHYIFMLRDVAEQALMVPGKCRVLRHPRTPNSAAVALRNIGKPAIPALLELLDDPRPTRSFSSEMNGNHLLRYSDVALEVIESIAGQQFDSRTQRGAYLANTDNATRALIIARARTWWKDHKEATEAQWIRESLSETGIGSLWSRLNSAERLIELEGAQSVGFFRERVQVEPDNPHLPRLLFQAGGKVVLEDIRSMALSGDLEVRQAAAKILQQIQDADAKPNPAATKPTSQPNG